MNVWYGILDLSPLPTTPSTTTVTAKTKSPDCATGLSVGNSSFASSN